MLFINLPVADVAASTRFYEAIGCTLNPQFSNANAASMEFTDTITFMLSDHATFASFAPPGAAIARAGTNEALFAFSCEDRAAVDAVTEAAIAAGGKGDVSAPHDERYMYGRSFEDLDGHGFGPMWMDPGAAAQAMTPDAA